MVDPGLKNLVHEALRGVLGTMCLSSPGLVIGSAAAKVKIANTVPFAIDAVLYSKTTAEIAFTDLTVQQASTYCKYLLSVDAEGNGTITNGTPAATSALALIPDCPDDECSFGYVELAVAAEYSFTPATTELSATGITDVYTNLLFHNGY